MQNENFIERISSNFSQSASIKNVFGEPVRAGEKTIIPVARVAYGFGGGAGQGKRKAGDQQHGDEGSGSGAGGGLNVCAKGVYEITPTTTRFIPASPVRYVLAGLVGGLLLSSLLGRNRR